ncbi:unnamed protein product [Nesidiocoris tenuis]|uniref:Uncharacterized protein n=1 Tax=Nesidiocoris tenuis TaxID=355587 RepID=A0A6H5G7S6_9HEMI|nr:unnamed protein product [Nesidiocoris tenuis]
MKYLLGLFDDLPVNSGNSTKIQSKPRQQFINSEHGNSLSKKPQCQRMSRWTEAQSGVKALTGNWTLKADARRLSLHVAQFMQKRILRILPGTAGGLSSIRIREMSGQELELAEHRTGRMSRRKIRDNKVTQTLILSIM